MKKLILALVSSFLMLSAFSAIHQKFEEGYVMTPSAANTTKNETAMSFMKDMVIYSVGDSASTKLFGSTINGSTLDLNQVEEIKAMEGLGIYGTFAHDEEKNTIYFSRYDKKTKNYMLYQSTQKGNSWSKPKRMKIEGLKGFIHTGSAMVNAGWLYREPGFSGFFNPTLADGGRRVYFSGNFSGGLGNRDIWFVESLGKKKWTMPQNVGANVNTDGRDDYPFVLGDSLLYFATTTKSMGNLDIAMSRKGADEKWQSASVLSETYNSSSSDYNLVADNNSLLFISSRNAGNGDDIFYPGRLDLPPVLMLPEPQPSPEPVESIKTFPWKIFYFDFDKYALTPEFQREVDELYLVMQDYMMDNDFVIRGHTDSRGSDAYNDRLSVRRATTVYNMLVQRGIPASKMKIEGFGERQLAVPNAQTEEEHALNRRVEIDIVKK